jgi:hypothetical protein
MRKHERRKRAPQDHGLALRSQLKSTPWLELSWCEAAKTSVNERRRCCGTATASFSKASTFSDRFQNAGDGLFFLINAYDPYSCEAR